MEIGRISAIPVVPLIGGSAAAAPDVAGVFAGAFRQRGGGADVGDEKRARRGLEGEDEAPPILEGEVSIESLDAARKISIFA